jgi:hypothetical protein
VGETKHDWLGLKLIGGWHMAGMDGGMWRDNMISSSRWNFGTCERHVEDGRSSTFDPFVFKPSRSHT